MQTVGYPGSLLAKVLTIYAQPGGRIRVILVPETLGFRGSGYQRAAPSSREMARAASRTWPISGARGWRRA